MNKVVLKPSSMSSSGCGVGVTLFQKENGQFVHNNDILSIDYLNKYGDNLVLQEVIEQHPFLSQFCHTSCNTMRVMTYRSIVDESINVFGAILRIGHHGSFVDNLFAGGGFVTIDVETGKLGSCIYDEYGRTTKSINNVSFNNQEFILPFWKDIVDFAKNITFQIDHHRLIALDISIDKNDVPKLIEFNVTAFNWTLAMYAGKIPLGDKFDEVIDYCLKHKQQ